MYICNKNNNLIIINYQEKKKDEDSSTINTIALMHVLTTQIWAYDQKHMLNCKGNTRQGCVMLALEQPPTSFACTQHVKKNNMMSSRHTQGTYCFQSSFEYLLQDPLPAGCLKYTTVSRLPELGPHAALCPWLGANCHEQCVDTMQSQTHQIGTSLWRKLAHTFFVKVFFCGTQSWRSPSVKLLGRQSQTC